MKRTLVCFCILGSLFTWSADAKDTEEVKAKKELVKRLSKTTDPQYVQKVFESEGLVMNDPRSKLLSTNALNRGVRYWDAHSELFEKIEVIYGIEPEYILAILRIETFFGEFVGKEPAINTFYTSFVRVPHERDDTAKQIEALLQYAIENGLDAEDVDSINGSSAGAIGIPQFMPASIKPYAVDGNEDGRINLFTHEDAIASVAYYLLKNGWGAPDKKRRGAVLAYNHSSAYANDVFTFAHAIRQEKEKRNTESP